MLLLKNVYIAVFVVIVCLIKAQTIKFEQFTTKDGLLSDEVYNLHQDRKGYIWVFTHYGPMKYNGKGFVPTLKNLSFKESIIYAIYENKDGRKWIVNSNKNIYEIIGDSAFIVGGTQNESEILRKNAHEVYQIYVDDSLNIYLKTTLEALKLLKRNNYRALKLNELLVEDSCDENVIKLGNIFIPIRNRHSSVSFNIKKTSIKFTTIQKLTKGSIISVAVGGSSKYYKQLGEDIYFNFFNKVIKVKPDLSLKEIVINEQILNFTKDYNNHLWLASYRNGLIEVDEHDSIINHYFKGKTINDVLVDVNNGLWISTDGAGLYHCENLNKLYYDESNALGKPVNFIKKIDKKAFVGTTDFNLFFLENMRATKTGKDNYEMFDDPLDIYEYKSSYIVCYRLHYEILDPDKNFSARRFIYDKVRRAPQKIVSYNGKILFMGRDRIGILDDGPSILNNMRYAAIKEVFINCTAFCMEKYNETIFIGTDKGVLCMKRDSLFHLDYLDGLKNCVVTNIRIDRQNNYWFCTKGDGLFQLNNQKKLIHYTTSNGLSSNIVNDMYFVKDSSFLLSNNKGLYYYNNYSKSELKDFIKLIDGEVQTSVVERDKIYVGTKSGLILINVKSLSIKPSIFFNLKSILINDKESNEKSIKSLNYRENNLEFRFDVISNSREEYPLKYILQGNTSDTGVVNDNILSFKKLSPGNYTLKIMPVIKNTHKEIVIYFNIIPAFWQTNWFFILSVLCIVVFIIYWAWLVFRYYKNKELRKNEAEKIIAEYRLIALKAQINPHFMSNCIAAIQHLILKNKVDEANEYLAKFSFLVRQVLNFSAKSFVTLKEELEIIDLYIKLEKLRFKKINFDLKIDPSVNKDTTLIPPLLLQPIIENAIWHGLLPLSHEKTAVLSIKMKISMGILEIIIEDNGIGRKLIKEGISNSKESKGIAITKQRIENLKYIVNQDIASLIYEDLVDDKHNAIGTRVIISLPTNLHQ